LHARSILTGRTQHALAITSQVFFLPAARGATARTSFRSLTLKHPPSQASPLKRLATHEAEFRFSQKGEPPMSEQNKTIVRRTFDELWNKGNLSLADEFFSPIYDHHDPSTPDVGRGPESEKKRTTLYRNAFPDLRLTVEGLVAEGETVVARWSCHGTHKGELNGIAPTGKQFTISGVTIAHFENGKMVEGWVNWDALGLMQQLGIVPEIEKTKVAVAASTR
jgi:steroid delta-isomerase-like uncharacterized protein